MYRIEVNEMLSSFNISSANVNLFVSSANIQFGWSASAILCVNLTVSIFTVILLDDILLLSSTVRFLISNPWRRRKIFGRKKVLELSRGNESLKKESKYGCGSGK